MLRRRFVFSTAVILAPVDSFAAEPSFSETALYIERLWQKNAKNGDLGAIREIRFDGNSASYSTEKYSASYSSIDWSLALTEFRLDRPDLHWGFVHTFTDGATLRTVFRSEHIRVMSQVLRHPPKDRFTNTIEWGGLDAGSIDIEEIRKLSKALAHLVKVSSVTPGSEFFEKK